jgi:hypothetical protein
VARDVVILLSWPIRMALKGTIFDHRTFGAGLRALASVRSFLGTNLTLQERRGTLPGE